MPVIKAVLEEAIAAGGSSLRDYVQTEGELGYFQHSWRVYAPLLDPFAAWGDVDCARLPDLASVSERVLPAAREAAKLAGTQGGTR